LIIKLKNKNAQAFIDHMRRTCQSNGIRFRPVDNDHVITDDGNNIHCLGYFNPFSEGGPILSFATDLYFEDWFRIAVHEFCHVEQWLAKPTTPETRDFRKRFWDWLDHKIELTSEEVHAVASDILQREADAERRTLAMIEKYKLPLDIKSATKTMNWYLYSYQYAEKHRDWLLKKDLRLYNHSLAWEAMPTQLSDNYETTHEPFMNLFEQAYQENTGMLTRKRAYSIK